MHIQLFNTNAMPSMVTWHMTSYILTAILTLSVKAVTQLISIACKMNSYIPYVGCSGCNVCTVHC